MEVLKEIQDVINKLNEIDNYSDNLSKELSILDTKQQDLLHYIEFNKIDIFWCYRMIKEIKSVREKRRTVKNDMEILFEYNKQKNKLAMETHRQFLLSELHKKEKKLNKLYTNKQYTEEELNRAANILIDYYKTQKHTKFLELETLTKLANIAYGGNWIYMNINGFHKAEWNYIIYDRDQMHFDSKEAEEDFINVFTAYCYDLGSQWEVFSNEQRLGYCYSPYDVTSLDKLKRDILKRFEKENEEIKIIPFKEYIKTPVWGEAL